MNKNMQTSTQENKDNNNQINHNPQDKNLCMLPFDRPSSPWKKGAVIFLSTDGTFTEYEPEE